MDKFVSKKQYKLCKDCKHFKPNITFRSIEGQVKFGLCTKSAVINLVDGTSAYNMALVARDTECKGDLWDPMITGMRAINY